MDKINMIREKINCFLMAITSICWLPLFCCIGCWQIILIKCGCMEDVIERDIRLMKEKQGKEQEMCESFEDNIDLEMR